VILFSYSNINEAGYARKSRSILADTRRTSASALRWNDLNICWQCRVLPPAGHFSIYLMHATLMSEKSWGMQNHTDALPVTADALLVTAMDTASVITYGFRCASSQQCSNVA